ncbi:hypothetical protein NPIL_44931 [Nephila pilipes]|uniref:Uncharacterized protein n=1 Tax=Nephila pilipes TaxID=299642 RepID=A0A8X6QLA9_NEPPI|nr:hypothetical protein NPIL_44931 [Nephila pilipes]
MKTAVVLRELSHRRRCRINNEDALVSAGRGNGAGKLWSASTHSQRGGGGGIKKTHFTLQVQKDDAKYMVTYDLGLPVTAQSRRRLY